MNNYFKITLLLLTGFLHSTCYAQDDYRVIEIFTKSGVRLDIGNYSTFNFIGKDGVKYNAKVNIVSDSQFVFYNFFNELEKDTFNIKFVDYVNIKGGPQKYKIRPGLIVLGLIFTPGLTVPVLIFKLLVKKRVYQWVGSEDFTIQIKTRQTAI